MAMAYATLLERVRQWSNRDAEALPNIVIQEGLRWSADTAYRELQTPPLEFTQQYVLLNSDDPMESISTLDPADTRQVNIGTRGGIVGLTTAKLPIPEDLTTFIQIRIIGAASRTEDQAEGTTEFLKDPLTLGIEIDEGSIRSSIVFNEKTDIRTFYDGRAIKVSSFYWSRQQNNIVIAGRLNANDVIEVLYYRRLPALDARYKLEVTDYNADTGFTMFVDQTVFIMGDADEAVTQADINLLGLNEASLTPDDFLFLNDRWYAGAGVDHWLRDQNERILIFGALWQAFDYLGDDAMGQKYAQKYQLEMQEINKEELRRKASGGNTQVHYSSNLI